MGMSKGRLGLGGAAALIAVVIAPAAQAEDFLSTLFGAFGVHRPQPPAISAAPSWIKYWRRSRFIRVLFPLRCCPPAPIPFRWSRPALARQERGGSFSHVRQTASWPVMKSNELETSAKPGT